MSKADRAKKRAKAKADLEATMALPKAKKRTRRGQGAATYKQNRDLEPSRPALEKRAKLMGKKATEWREMRAQALSEPAGRAIMTLCGPEDAARLWDTYARLTAAEMRYMRLKLGLSASPSGASLVPAPETTQSIADDNSTDPRSFEERLRSATNRWMEWNGWMGQLSGADQQAIWDVVRGRASPWEEGCTDSSRAKSFVAALRRLAEISN